MAIDRGLVTSGRRTGERRRRSEKADVVEGTAGEGKERVKRQTNGAGDALDLAEEHDKVIGGDASGSVVLRFFPAGTTSGAAERGARGRSPPGRRPRRTDRRCAGAPLR